MKDKIMTCIQCGNTFVFTAAEQARFIARGFDRPKRCPQCRKNRARGIEMNKSEKGKNNKRHRRRRDDYEFHER